MNSRWLPGLACGVLLACSARATETPIAPNAPTPPTNATVAPDPSTISTALLPAGEHRELVVRACALCHPIELVVSQHRTVEQWDALLVRMIDYGAIASDAEQQQIFEYLAKYFGRPPNP